MNQPNRPSLSRLHDDAGVALITTLLMLVLLAALMAGFFAAVSADMRSNAMDRDQTRAYAAAHAGLEKMTSDLAYLFTYDVSPSVAQINAIATHPPVIPGYEYRAPGGAAGSGYSVTFKTDANGNPAPDDPMGSNITAGAYRGFKGIVTKYPITVTARSTTGGSEVRLRREIQTVAVPVFQFGTFSETDLSIFAGSVFNFGGRVHTNGSLFVASQTGSGNSITFGDRITAVKEVIHNYLSNGQLNTTTSPSFTSPVYIPTSASTNRNLLQSPNEGSVDTMPGSTANGNWTTISTTTYKSYIRTGSTGATNLSLPLVSQGAVPVDLVRRPPANEDTAQPAIYNQRFYALASLRILLSDRLTDFTSLPTITAGAALQLDGDWSAAAPVGYGPVDATHPPIARSPGEWTGMTTKSSSCCSGSTIKTSAAVSGDYALPSGTNLVIGTNLSVTCTGKNATQFLQCSFATANITTGQTVTATLPSGRVVTSTVSGGPYNKGTPRDITIATPTNGIAAFTTAPFAVNTFFISGELYTCTGYDTTPQFTGCDISVAPPNNTALTSAAVAARNTGTIGGYIKIEKQSSTGVWTDVTMEILNLGIGDQNQQGGLCADPTPDAVLRIQRLRDNNGANCPYAQSRLSWDWWPNTLYDAREGSIRDRVDGDNMTMAGVMQYVTLDVGNLKRWFSGAIGTTGTIATAANNNGYIVYFSDRRGNHNAGAPVADVETGEFGFEDQVNPTTSAGTADNLLQAGEDMNGDGVQQVYGETPSAVGGNIPATSGNAAYANYSAASRPWTELSQANAGSARASKVVLFRRALKIDNAGISGGVNNLPTAGLTIATENPAYVQGNFNATTSDPAAEPNVPSSIIADAVSLLSNNWTDVNSFEHPNSAVDRPASTTSYRFAVIAGKGVSFPYCGAACGSPGDLFGTDGGVANFLRMLEDWSPSSGTQTTGYRGSIVSLFNSRQAIGTYKFTASNGHTYAAGVRNFSFDTDFLTPSLLPPGTPMFRDINTLTFRQVLRPTQ